MEVISPHRHLQMHVKGRTAGVDNRIRVAAHLTPVHRIRIRVVIEKEWINWGICRLLSYSLP